MPPTFFSAELQRNLNSQSRNMMTTRQTIEKVQQLSHTLHTRHSPDSTIPPPYYPLRCSSCALRFAPWGRRVKGRKTAEPLKLATAAKWDSNELIKFAAQNCLKLHTQAQNQRLTVPSPCPPLLPLSACAAARAELSRNCANFCDSCPKQIAAI